MIWILVRWWVVNVTPQPTVVYIIYVIDFSRSPKILHERLGKLGNMLYMCMPDTNCNRRHPKVLLLPLLLYVCARTATY